MSMKTTGETWLHLITTTQTATRQHVTQVQKHHPETEKLLAHYTKRTAHLS